MVNLPLALAFLVSASPAPQVELVEKPGQRHLAIDGKPTLIKGMNWGWMPIGQNYTFQFYDQPRDVIIEALDRDMTLLKEMGINALRQFDGVPPEWIEYIYDRWGIMTSVNNFLGRYGMTVDGRWESPINYENPRTREVILESVRTMAERYKDTRGMVFFMLGNENNYGLHWSSYEIEALPQGEQDVARATHLYTLLGEAAEVLKEVVPHRMIVWANGDLQYMDLFTKHAPKVDIFGSNVYRGESARDLFERVEKESGRAVVFTEFGSDAFNAREHREDGASQAYYLHKQWSEIYQQSRAPGVGNAIGGFIFQWSDGWWKTKQDEDLEIHNTDASWPNGGYPFDHVEGQNNMNEEWFGIAAKGPTDQRMLYEVYPRPAYYVLRDMFRYSPYEMTPQQLADVENLVPAQTRDLYNAAYETDRIERASQNNDDLRMDVFRIKAEVNIADRADLLDELEAVEHQETLLMGFRYSPDPSLNAGFVLHGAASVLQNPINEIYYENKGVPREVEASDDLPLTLNDIERFRLYQFDMHFESTVGDFDAYYRKGHYHWAYDDGDLYGFYPEANYQHSVDMYNSNTPFGLEFTGKDALRGLRVAVGPEIFWGANPMAIVKYDVPFGHSKLTMIHREEFPRLDAAQSGGSSSFAGPEHRRTSLVLETNFYGWDVDIGLLASGSNKVGDHYTTTREAETTNSYLNSGYSVLDGSIEWKDTFGADIWVTGWVGAVGVHARAGYRGLVAEGGADPRIHLTGWSLKPSGAGNNMYAELGFVYGVGNLQIAPNFLIQKPLEAPLPTIEEAFFADDEIYYAGLRPRSYLDSPFAVLSNRETIAAELLLVWDPTPGTWYWMWDNLMREDATLAGSIDFVYRHHPTTRDSMVGFLESGIPFSQGSSPSARDHISVNARIVMRPGAYTRMLLDGYIAHDDPSIGGEIAESHWPWRKSARLQFRHQGWLNHLIVKVDDFGPYDYHRDFNLTYPLQAEAMLSWGPKTAPLYDPDTRLGVIGAYRRLDEHSNRYNEALAGMTQSEWEIRFFVEVSHVSF